jgi:hypothetical protein
MFYWRCKPHANGWVDLKCLHSKFLCQCNATLIFSIKFTWKSLPQIANLHILVKPLLKLTRVNPYHTVIIIQKNRQEQLIICLLCNVALKLLGKYVFQPKFLFTLCARICFVNSSTSQRKWNAKIQISLLWFG